MKFIKIVAAILSLVLVFTACGNRNEMPSVKGAVEITLSDKEIKVDGKNASTDNNSAVYTANDIVYYESGKDFSYGEGTEKDAHSKEEAASHIVVHITKAGTYSLSGKLSLGQIAIDLGEDAKEDPNAVVNLILNDVDITCKVAPAVIFYNVFECGSTDTEKATSAVDTSKAGANVIIADGSRNIVNGSYVEKIYKPESVVLNDAKTEVEDAKKLHKYDAAFYSKMSMNVYGDKKGTGILDITAENEGLDSELHLTINGGNINIASGNDGINTNEDGVSVTTINSGTLRIKVTGETGEGDGIDSNGWLVINGGFVSAAACANSADAGIDSDMGIHINGGTVIATGSMLDRIENGGQNYAVFNFAKKEDGKNKIVFKNEKGNVVFEHTPENAYAILIYSSPDLSKGTYTLFSGDKQLKAQGGGAINNMQRPQMKPNGEDFNGNTPPEPPEGYERPNGDRPMDRPELPEGVEPPEKLDGQERPQLSEGEMPPVQNPNTNNTSSQELTVEFKISDGANIFYNVSYCE